MGEVKYGFTDHFMECEMDREQRKKLTEEMVGKIYEYMKKKGDVGCSPTEIGMQVGDRGYHVASAWASRWLMRLRDRNLVERADKTGWWRAK